MSEPQGQAKAEPKERRPSVGGEGGGGGRGNRGGGRGGKRNPSQSSRSTSGTRNDSGSDTGGAPKRGGNPSRGGGGGRGAPHRKGPSNAQRNNKDNKSPPSPKPPQGESSDALSSLQRVIADLKSTSPQPVHHQHQQPAAPSASNNSSAGISVNAPVFQPSFQPQFQAGAAVVHRKANSLGPGLSNNFNGFAPGLGSMREDAEEGQQFEEGEIAEFSPHPNHQPRSQSQSFVPPPRFTALQEQQISDLGPTGRPTLAPSFTFGARKQQPQRQGSLGAGPPITEEDAAFQFPNQAQLQTQPFQPTDAAPTHRKTESGEITGIMAEQVSKLLKTIV